MELEPLLQIFGGAGATFYVMWQWLKSVQQDKKDLLAKLEIVEEKRITELSTFDATERYLKLKKEIPNIDNLIQ